MAKDVPWDDETDSFISDMDQMASEKYKISLRSLLLNPGKYAARKDLGETVSKIKTDAEQYFADLLGNLKDEQAKLNAELESADSQYRSVDSIITNKAAAARVPYVRPLFVSRNPANEEVIVIDKYEETLDALIGKLVGVSNYVADVSTVYKTFRFGSWIFSGQKNYVLTINPPVSPVLMIENSRNIINEMLNDIAGRSS